MQQETGPRAQVPIAWACTPSPVAMAPLGEEELVSPAGHRCLLGEGCWGSGVHSLSEAWPNTTLNFLALPVWLPGFLEFIPPVSHSAKWIFKIILNYYVIDSFVHSFSVWISVSIF